jgi:hypothetical protein
LHFEFISYLERRLLWLRWLGDIATERAGGHSYSNAGGQEAQKDRLDSNLLRMHGLPSFCREDAPMMSGVGKGIREKTGESTVK